MPNRGLRGPGQVQWVRALNKSCRMSLHQNEARKERTFSFQEYECCGVFRGFKNLECKFSIKKMPECTWDHPLAPSATNFAHAAPFFDLGVLLYLRHETTRDDHIDLLRIRIGPGAAAASLNDYATLAAPEQVSHKVDQRKLPNVSGELGVHWCSPKTNDIVLTVFVQGDYYSSHKNLLPSGARSTLWMRPALK